MTPTPSSSSPPGDLLVHANPRRVLLARVRGGVVQPLLQVPLGPRTPPPMVRRVLLGSLRWRDARYVFLSLARGTPYEGVTEPVFDAVEEACQLHGARLVWLPDLDELAAATRLPGPGPGPKPLPRTAGGSSPLPPPAV